MTDGTHSSEFTLKLVGQVDVGPQATARLYRKHPPTPGNQIGRELPCPYAPRSLIRLVT
jgi:hypothetical protein